MMHETNWSTFALDRIAMTNLASKAHHLMMLRFGRDLFSAPAFEMLLDLYLRPRPRSLTALTAASSQSERNSQRIIHRMVEVGLLQCYRDPKDGRRKIVELTPEAIEELDSFFDQLVTLAQQNPTRTKAALGNGGQLAHERGLKNSGLQA
nr:MarR family winged helix-turn-helix transcriptional regulator [Sphingomonas sp. CDS-1]